jgi:hypothetical protein
MEDNVRKEIETLEQMVLNWKQSYLSMATPGGGHEYLVEDFQAEVTEYVSPFVRRLFECKHLSPEEVSEFLDCCYNHVEDLRKLLKETEAPPPKEGLWQKIVQVVVRK